MSANLSTKKVVPYFDIFLDAFVRNYRRVTDPRPEGRGFSLNLRRGAGRRT